ncbi:hypothetical protein BS50DRAFT_657816 [Corynespora cassiicola Philippines]|uniref:Uncharacterized protein n=1 Tax=Corynespora cassiicola Philippines TaxID=1448308 RepID=A0A2T2P3Y0_CORCC|nr:hypothetical protein BS50DRAFT_657816 [Corynespora cassiicola Philippines]
MSMSGSQPPDQKSTPRSTTSKIPGPRTPGPETIQTEEVFPKEDHDNFPNPGSMSTSEDHWPREQKPHKPRHRQQKGERQTKDLWRERNYTNHEGGDFSVNSDEYEFAESKMEMDDSDGEIYVQATPSENFPNTWEAARNETGAALREVTKASKSYYSAIAKSGITKAGWTIGGALAKSVNYGAATAASYAVSKTGTDARKLPSGVQSWLRWKDKSDEKKRRAAEIAKTRTARRYRRQLEVAGRQSGGSSVKGSSAGSSRPTSPGRATAREVGSSPRGRGPRHLRSVDTGWEDDMDDLSREFEDLGRHRRIADSDMQGRKIGGYLDSSYDRYALANDDDEEQHHPRGIPTKRRTPSNPWISHHGSFGSPPTPSPFDSHANAEANGNRNRVSTEAPEPQSRAQFQSMMEELDTPDPVRKQLQAPLGASSTSSSPQNPMFFLITGTNPHLRRQEGDNEEVSFIPRGQTSISTRSGPALSLRPSFSSVSRSSRRESTIESPQVGFASFASTREEDSDDDEDGEHAVGLAELLGREY